MIQASSSSASISFDGQTVTIHRTRTRGNHPLGSRSIPIGQIAGVQLKPAQSRFTGGWIKFLIPGTAERVRRGGKAFDTGSLTDPNTVAFSRATQAAFVALKDAVEHAIAQQAAGHGVPPVADELTKLVGLLRQGVLSQAEFESAKAQLLG
jgi:hypothetical protein